MKRRVVITGMGVVAPNGIGKDEFWTSLKEGRSGIKKISSFFRYSRAGAVPEE